MLDYLSSYFEMLSYTDLHSLLLVQNRSGFRWVLFTLDNSAKKPDEVLVVDLHTPTNS